MRRLMIEFLSRPITASSNQPPFDSQCVYSGINPYALASR